MSIDATITMLRRTQKRSVEYTVEYVDAGGKSMTAKGRSSILWSWLIPHGFDVDAVIDGEHKVNIPCEYDGRRITNIPMLRPMIDVPMPVRSTAKKIAVRVHEHPPRRGNGIAWLAAAVTLLIVATMVVKSARN